ncbi:hypothetical protein LCGC14_2548910 [marine sediment metagenome]|uniref:Uncharacterized protein n=1 Tax=marine sediment metagenome TaxID=412755 RepID=A0A0F9ANZ3_9ZZZZ
MGSSKLFKNIKIDKIYINKEIFKNYIDLYEVFNNQVKKIDPKVSKKMIKILEDGVVMAIKINKKIIEYKNKGATDKSEKTTNLNITFKLCENILKKFGKK